MAVQYLFHEHLKASKRGLEATVQMDSERMIVATELIRILNKEDNQQSPETEIRNEIHKENHEPSSVRMLDKRDTNYYT